MRRMWLNLLLALPVMCILGCGEYGKVDQGRVVAFDKDKKVVTIIRDKKIDTLNPDYSYLPPLTYTLPADPNEMGPEPRAGGRMKLDMEKSEIVFYDGAIQNFVHVPFKLVERKEGIAKDNPLVKDKKLPAVDKDKKTVTIYSGRQKLYVVVQVGDEYMKYPDAEWDAGDEVRIYYKEDGKALRLMNISKTDIYKK